ncbi:acetyl-CoA C-acyltransferase [Candidatus Neomarinimicrobiota bacterium]
MDSPPNGRIAIVGGVRTPFAKAFTDLNNLNASDLAKLTIQELVQRWELPGSEVDQVIWGSVIPTMSNLNIGREAPLALGWHNVPGFTLGQQCASGIQAVTSAAQAIGAGQAQVIVAGGSESMSNTPVPHRKRLIEALQGMMKARSMGQRLAALKKVKLGDFVPRPPALEEPSTGLTMGQHGEIMAQINGISRKDQDAYAVQSHQKAAAARKAGRVNDDLVPVPIPPKYSSHFAIDNLIREDTDEEQMGRLRPVFDRKHGTLTAGNSSALTDGAAVVLVMSESRAKALGFAPWGYLKAYRYVAIPPNPQLLLGPAYSTPAVLDAANMELSDIDLLEIHEAFAAQVLSVTQKLESEQFARDELGRSAAVGKVDWDRLNVNGGSLAYGHPFAATGGRLVINLLQELGRRDKENGLLTICTANAMGVSMILERA